MKLLWSTSIAAFTTLGVFACSSSTSGGTTDGGTSGTSGTSGDVADGVACARAVTEHDRCDLAAAIGEARGAYITTCQK